MQAQIIAIFIPLMTAVFAAIFAGLWWLDRSRLYVLAYGGWFAAVAIALSMQVWLISEFGPLEVVMFHLISSAGSLILIWGIATHDGRRIPLMAYVSLCAGTGVILWFARFYEVQTVVVMAQNFNIGVLYAMCAYEKWRTPHRHLADRLLLASLIVFVAYSFFRPSIMLIIQQSMTMEQYQNSAFISANLAMESTLCLILASNLLAVIVMDRLSDQQRECSIDPLTGLRMRRAFEQDANRLLENAKIENGAASVIACDIDHFKAINDTWGHSVGDNVIATFGRLIAGRIRPNDAAGRIGGEEFCIVVCDCDLEHACQLADRIRIAAHGLNAREGEQNLAVSASFGVAAWKPGLSYSALFDLADRALYKAKRGGRDRVCFADDEGQIRGLVDDAEVGAAVIESNVVAIKA